MRRIGIPAASFQLKKPYLLQDLVYPGGKHSQLHATLRELSSSLDDDGIFAKQLSFVFHGDNVKEAVIIDARVVSMTNAANLWWRE